VPLLRYTIEPKTEEEITMQRKWLIAIVIIAIIIVGGLGWYQFFWPQPEEEKPIQVFIDGNNYTMPLVWNVTAVNGTTIESDPHNLLNNETTAMSVTFNFAIWHYNTTSNQWIKEFNGTHWLVNQTLATVLVSLANQTKVTRFVYTEKKSVDPGTYTVVLMHTESTIYVKFMFTGGNPTVDGQTVFAYLAFDGNGNNLLDAQDKAFNFTNNPNRQNINQLKIYTPISDFAWNTTATEYSWNETVPPSDVPITVVMSNDKKNITWAIPFTYIGAERDATIGFFFQAFGYDWGIAGATPTMPAKYAKATLSLAEVLSFRLNPLETVKFLIKVQFGANASGEYSFVYETKVRQVS
jgi:hypothetical protein